MHRGTSDTGNTGELDRRFKLGGNYFPSPLRARTLAVACVLAYLRDGHTRETRACMRSAATLCARGSSETGKYRECGGLAIRTTRLRYSSVCITRERIGARFPPERNPQRGSPRMASTQRREENRKRTLSSILLDESLRLHRESA